ncbi:MAG TPA: hypothetical protein DCG54_07455 [Anaerolineae bacterium]|jgi:hypothetical protein|nr:hypothetical protein [Anaerolineae bacterium]
MVKMGDFLNEFASKMHVFPALVVGALIGALVFSYWYNRIVEGDTKGNRSLYVIGGVLVSLGLISLFSWKAGLLGLVVFSCTGLFMAIGDYQRGIKRAAKASEAKPRIKRATYKINGLVDSCAMSVEQSSNYLLDALKKRDQAELIRLIALAQNEFSNMRLTIEQIRNIQKEG